jgi:predicted ATPase/class 3 adenylate cyclase/Tfp pilus assembly protein PilF
MPALTAPPTGTVTFLFTDIEGSTKLWEQYPDAMRSALARHDVLLRGAIDEHGGYVFKTVGDAFCAAFATAPQALAGALSAQIALADASWEIGTPLRVRIALHTGSAEERDGDYFGPPLNRVARLIAAGHGGQTLLSLAAQELTRDALPSSASLLDLGAHRLKDLGRPETVFQLLHPSQPAEFPPLRSLDNPALPNNLPQQPTSFIGREAQVAEARALLAKTRLLTLTGAGGSGKTRLSLQVAADLLDGEGDGVWLVELAGLSDSALVPQAVAQVLGVKEAAGKSIQQSLVEWLRPKRLLVILDNCEHLVAACASLAADILRGCSDVRILASSREPLVVAGEQTYRVPTLSLPDPKKAQTAESLSQYEAVRLFVERAQAVQPTFSVTDANAPAVVQVCFHLDGIPLAIELAAARVRSLSAEEINRRLDQRFRLLTGGARNTLPRQQTLRALIDWSYDLLTGPEKALLRRLSVFAGGWTLSAAEVVCEGEPVEDFEVLDLLTALVDKSLVVVDPFGDGTRYRLLETVRQYGGDRLGESGEAEAIQDAHLSWCVALAEEADQQGRGPDEAAWLSRLEAEHDNLRAGLSWGLSLEERLQGKRSHEDGLRLAASLWRFWSNRGHLSEGRRWLGLARARASVSEGEASVAQAKVLAGAGYLAQNQGDFAEARTLGEESLTLFRQAGDQRGCGTALRVLAMVAHGQGDWAEARAFYEQSLTISRQEGPQWAVAHTLRNLGEVTLYLGDYAEARALCEESLTLFRQAGNLGGIAYPLRSLALLAHYQGDYAEAQALYEESLTLFRQVGDHFSASMVLGSLGVLAHRQSQMGRSVRLLGADASLRESIGSGFFPADPEEIAAMLASAAEALGEATFTAAWDAGLAMTLDEAVEYALAVE